MPIHSKGTKNSIAPIHRSAENIFLVFWDHESTVCWCAKMCRLPSTFTPYLPNKCLYSLSHDEIISCPYWKHFQLTCYIRISLWDFASEHLNINVGKGKNAVFQYFLLLPSWFQKAFQGSCIANCRTCNKEAPASMDALRVFLTQCPLARQFRALT